MCTLASVHHVGSKLGTQGGILPFVKSIENDLADARERQEQGKEAGQPHSYSLLVANYGGMVALPTEPPFCLMYPMVDHNDMKDKTRFNTTGCPSGMHHDACVCHSLLHLMDTNPDSRQKFKGSHLLVPHSAQYRTISPVIAESCNHCKPLVDPNMGEPYPMEAVGNFCLEDAFFPGCLADSLVFCNNDLTQLAR